METIKDLITIAFVLSFCIMFLMVPVWFYLISKFFKYLKESYPDEYRAIGEPHLMSNNTPRHTSLFLKYISGNRPVEIGDPVLIDKCLLLKWFFYIYVAVFIFVFVSILSGVYS